MIKLIRMFAKSFGIVWMVLFGGFGSFYHFNRHPFNFHTIDGIGSFLGILLGIIVTTAPGYFLYWWGTKPMKKTSPMKNGLQEIFQKPKIGVLEVASQDNPKKSDEVIETKKPKENDKTTQEVFTEKYEETKELQKRAAKKVFIQKKDVQVFSVNYLSNVAENEPVKIISQPKIQFEEKFIDMDYIPNSILVQKGLEKTFPYVTIPKAGTKVLLPKPGKLKSSGVSEADFKTKLFDVFGKHILSQHFLIFKGAKNDYEPDFVFQEISRGLLVDIEIDEPYSGKSRNPMHYVGNSDIDRDHYFNKNGWVVIRFAEEQVIRNPLGCLLYLGQLVDSLIGTPFSQKLPKTGPLEKIKRWTFEEAEQMAKDFYREKYLGIKFEIEQKAYEEIETEIQLVKENRSPYGYIDVTYRDTAISQLSENESNIIQKIQEINNKNLFCTFSYAETSIHLVQPIKIETNRSVRKLIAFDFILNEEQEFEIRLIGNLLEIQSPFFQTLESNQGFEKFTEAIELAINNMLYIRFTYTNAYGEDSLRTLGPLDYTQEFDGWGYHRQHIAGYCHYRKELRSFRIDRIRQLWILNLGFD